MIYIKIIGTILIILAVIILSGCLGSDPTITGHATMRHIAVSYDLDVQIQNNRPVDLRLSDITVNLKRGNAGNWEILGSGVVKGGFIQAHSTGHLYGHLNVGDNILDAKNDQKLYLIYDLTASGSLFGVNIQTEQKEGQIELNNPINDNMININMN